MREGRRVTRTENKLLARKYAESVAVVTAAFSAWDPYRLAATGASEDEFEGEAASVIKALSKIETPRQLATVISDVFSAAFEPRIFTIEACESVSSRLFAQLRDRGLIGDS